MKKWLSPDIADKYGYHTGEEILPFVQGRIIERAKLTYYPLALKILKPNTQQLKIKENSKKSIE